MPHSPAAEPSPYITRAGYDALQAELKSLWKRVRPALVQKVAEAAAMGDRSENAEYIYGKKQLRETDRRIAYLSKRLDRLKVVERAPADRSKVFFGAQVELVRTQRKPSANEDARVLEVDVRKDGLSADEGDEAYYVQAGGVEGGLSDGLREAVLRYRLVGPDEADAAAGRISIDAPLARALLHKSAGALVSVDGAIWRLASVKYEDDQSLGGE